MKAMKSAVLAGLVAWLWAPAAGHAADTVPVVISEGRGFAEQDGASLYRAICQGCHMPQGQGATGAGHYPALAGNPRVGAATYVMLTVLRGRKGMPGFGGQLSDAQVAEVTNYVRSQLGNNHRDTLTAADVQPLR